MCPRSLAVIGASNKEHTIGSDIMKRLVEYGFTGKIFPINPKDSEIQGMTAYPSVLEVPEEIDMAVIVINAKYVLSAVDQCHQKGIKGIVVISAGFKETGAAGAELEAKLVNKVREYGMTCVGPNCLGVVNTDPKFRLDACFAESLPVRGDIGFVSQSGALGGGILNILQDLNLGLFPSAIRQTSTLTRPLSTGKTSTTSNRFFSIWNLSLIRNASARWLPARPRKNRSSP